MKREFSVMLLFVALLSAATIIMTGNIQTGITGLVAHTSFPQFAEPIPEFSIDNYSITFPNEQSADSITLTITDDAIYRYVQTSFDGQNWIQRTIQNSTQCTFHPDDPAHNWLTGTCTISIPTAASEFPSLALGTTLTRNYITAYTCDEILFPFFPFRIGWDCHGSADTPQMWQILQFNATLAEAPDPCEGVDCDDHDTCTTDSCSGGVCSHVSVGCVHSDGCCPSECTSSNDDDCEEEHSGPPLAFPEAEGFGKYTRGAYAGSSTPTICIVDSLAAESSSTGDNRGTFEWCITRNYPRVILFEVGGVIDYTGIQNQLSLTHSYVSMYGQTAPYPGITILGTDFAVSIGVHDVIIQNIKSRPGDIGGSIEELEIRDAMSVYGSNVIVDHCSFSFATDEVVAITSNSHDVTVSNCIVSHPLDEKLTGTFGIYIQTAYNSSYVRNLLAYNRDRSPIVVSNYFVFANNMNYVSRFIAGPRIYDDWSGNILYQSYVGNKMLQTQGTTTALKDCAKVYSSTHPVNPSSVLYFEDNICQRSIENPGNTDWQNVVFEVPLVEPSSSPIDLSEYELMPADDVEDYIMENAGAFNWHRDDYDQWVLDSVTARTGEGILSHDELPSNLWPVYYTPTSHSLSIPSNPHGDSDGDGYTNLEEWAFAYQG